MVVYIFYCFLALLCLIWAGVGISHALSRRRKRQDVAGKFQSRVTPELVEYVPDSPAMAMHKPALRDVSVLLTNLTDSVGMYERLGDLPAVDVIRRYYGVVTAAVRGHGGVVNKFLGDGVMAFFGGPSPDRDHAGEAVTTVLAIQDGIDALNGELTKEGLPPLVVRIGVASGLAMLGDTGSVTAVEYTVTGDVVDAAARLERLNKSTGTRNLVSDVTVARLNGKYRFRAVEPAGVADVKGAERLFEVVGQLADAAAR
jgi:adenylate cyclase